MASRNFNALKIGLFDGTIDLDNDDIRIALLMSNTNAGTVNDVSIVNLDDLTLDRCDSSGYSDAALANETVTKEDHPTNEAHFDADDVTFSALPASTRTIAGVLVYKFVTNDTDSIPLQWLEYATAKTLDGSDFVVKFHSDGLLKIA